jgi:hypothetical protein
VRDELLVRDPDPNGDLGVEGSPSPTRARAAGSSSRVKVQSMWIRTSPVRQRSATGSKWADPSFTASAPVWGAAETLSPGRSVEVRCIRADGDCAVVEHFET